MKHFVIAIVLLMFALSGISQSTVHVVKFQSLQGTVINMENYRGKKLIVYIVANSGDFVAIKKLKNLVDGSDSLIAIIVPVNDFNNSNIGANVIEFLRDSLPQNFIISGISNAKPGG